MDNEYLKQIFGLLGSGGTLGAGAVSGLIDAPYSPQKSNLSSMSAIPKQNADMEWVKKYEQFKNTNWEPTVLKPDEEQQFREWLQNTQIFNANKIDISKENNIPLEKLDNNRLVDMMLRDSNYDYRGAWKDGMQESISPVDNRPHMLSSTKEGKMLKDPSHPTAWKEFFMNQYRVDPDQIGLNTLEDALKWEKTRPLKTNLLD